ncbi:transcription-repair coupling factor [Candidatus Peregrinibacteria bacterium]|nr:transcription-repair coupling factor [Candidatus Peregrinibacteria bacterium]
METSLLLSPETHGDVVGLLKSRQSVVVSGLSNETAKTLLICHILTQYNQSSILVTESLEKAHTFSHWLSFFEGKADVMVSSTGDGISAQILRQFLLLMQGQGGVFIVPRALWDTPLPLFREFKRRTLTLSEKQTLPFTRFIESLIEMGYKHCPDHHCSPGEYRRIGDTLEIFPIQAQNLFKIEFRFDEIERITPKGKVEVFPVSFTQTELLSKQIPSTSVVIIDDQDDIPFLPDTVNIRFSAFPEDVMHHVHLRYLSVLKFYTLNDFLNDVRDKLLQDWTIVVVSKRIEELKGIFTEERISFTHTEKRPGFVTLVFSQKEDTLPHSIQNPDLRLALITDREIFSLRKSGKERSVQKLALDFITSLSPSDYVVHMEHGVGRFEGVTQKVIDDTTREYLELTYAEGDKLFVPVDQADKLSKFVYEEGEEPVLTRLGTSQWQKVSEKIQKETERIAKELLAIYAKRASVKGFAYHEDTNAQKKFEETFPYQETPGQIKAIEDIKRDMENDHPMDRLICGDVGFGKTEVAMRAAFKAVQDGKQVAVIAPITILADQHYHNFCDRMKGFNIRIEMLSRFRTNKEQDVILEKLRKGNINIIIGTHRLLQDDVKFLNLGLLIIDEEQRFGVKQKEKFKEFRSNLDILTLTATPIPRTLNLGLHKLRDISTITTPPPGRLPIITEVRKYSDALTREAVLFELKRRGQCFILHNRVETIDAFAEKLKSLIPEATFIVGHGQLKADELEERIMAFKEGKVDVLVSSTIIENGIDLPRANTLIVNAAEKFGLAQLYQLRGRVGRSRIQAHAYFLYHSQKLHEDAKKRLRAIVEACELGSGFQVAMRDLEIRGAGEILGAEQHGTMQTVGVSHYLRMLKNAVEELKAGRRGVVEAVENVEILLPIEALIPSFYIPDTAERISVYQKLAGSDSEEILKEFEKDIKEEYGEAPLPVRSLFRVLHLKLACRKGGVPRVKMEAKDKEEEVVLFLHKGVTAKEIMQLVHVHPEWRISGSTLRITLTGLQKVAGKKDWVEELTQEIALLQKKSQKREKK